MKLAIAKVEAKRYLRTKLNNTLMECFNRKFKKCGIARFPPS